MAYSKQFQRVNWLNKTDGLTTPLGKTLLNRGDAAIEAIDNEVVEMSQVVDSLGVTKANASDINGLVKSWEIDNSSGIVTLTMFDGSQKRIQTALSKVAVNFTYDPVQEKLIIEQSDHTFVEVDLSAIITNFSFKDSDTILITIDNTDHVSCDIKSGSVKLAHLNGEVLAELTRAESACKTSEDNAKESEDNAEVSNVSSESFCHGTTNTRSGEDTDNAKYYMEKAKEYSEISSNYSKVNNPDFRILNNRIYYKTQPKLKFAIYNNRMYLSVN